VDKSAVIAFSENLEAGSHLFGGIPCPQWIQDLTQGWPMIRANIPTFIVIVALIAGVVWAALSWSYGSIVSHQAAEIRLLERQKAEATATAKPGPIVDRASLRLHVYGDTRLPDRLSATNVWRWFYLNDVLGMMKQDGTKDREIVTSKLFISFDQPVGVGTMTVRSDKPLSHYEVKEFNNRFAIVVFGEALPECNIDIEVNP
jgi:hypothetical protein